MNKLASIHLLHKLGLPTIFPRIIQTHDESEVRTMVESFFYPRIGGWVLRCAELPNKDRKVERGLPWDMATEKEDLIRKIINFQRTINKKYVVFCHEQRDMVRGGIMMIDGNGVVVESATGGPRELSAFYRGYRSPEQCLMFKPGMLSQKRFGKEILSTSDVLDLRKIERRLNWAEINGIIDPVSIEFSYLKTGSLYVHDLSLVN